MSHDKIIKGVHIYKLIMTLKQNTIIKISLIVFILLFLVLTFIDMTTSPELIGIDNLTLNYLNEHVRIEGVIVKQSVYDDNSYLVIEDGNSQLDGVIFGIDKNFKEDREYFFEGKVVLYEQELELVIDKVY